MKTDVGRETDPVRDGWDWSKRSGRVQGRTRDQGPGTALTFRQAKWRAEG